MRGRGLALGALVLGGFLLLRGKGTTKLGRCPCRSSQRTWTYQDQHDLARILVIEAGDIGPGVEWGAIAWVVMNRAGVTRSIQDVALDGWSGSSFVSKFLAEATARHRRFGDALSFAWSALSGRQPNTIGEREQLVHPGRMPTCQDDDDCSTRTLCHTGRCMPTWAVAAADGGASRYPPLRQGRAVFAGAP